jgi:hypothetical protein
MSHLQSSAHISVAAPCAGGGSAAMKKAVKKRSDVANFAMRIFLQKVGEAYDTLRKFEIFKPTDRQWQEVLDYFGGRCCYCGSDLGIDGTQDHLVPQNKKQLGLHCWGNVVASCPSCNKNKQHRDWQVFLAEVCDGSELQHRERKIQAFVAKYNYRPNLEIKEIAENLYEDVGAVAMTLIELRFKQATKIIQGIHGPVIVNGEANSILPKVKSRSRKA